MRRFWQSSTDHRGTPERPGRVVTLISHEDIMKDPGFEDDLKLHDRISGVNGPEDLKTLGVVYYIPPEYAEEVKRYLDIREQGGYTLHEVEAHLETSPEQESELGYLLQALPSHEITGRKILTTSVYIGTVSNESFVGPENISHTARIIAESHGPSGPNYKYAKLLHESLIGMSIKHNNRVITDEYLNRLLWHVENIRLKEKESAN